MKKKLGLILLLLISVISIFTLSACGGSNDDDDDEACKHKLGEWVEEIPATCTNDGTKGYYTCSDCGKNFDSNKNELSDLVINKIGGTHNFVNDICTKCDFKIV